MTRSDNGHAVDRRASGRMARKFAAFVGVMLAAAAGAATAGAQLQQSQQAQAQQAQQAQNEGHGTTAQASEAAQPMPGRFFVEVEPLLFAARGYSGSFGVLFDANRRWAASIGVFGADLPDGVRDLFYDDADTLDLRVEWGISADIRYRVTSDLSGWQAGVMIGAERFRARAANDAEQDAINGFVTPHAGYLWHPRRGRFFLYARVGAIVIISRDREQQIDGVTYRQRTVVPNATVRLGFRF